MRTPPTIRRAPWLPGVLVLAAAVGMGAALGLALGTQSWPLYLGLTLGSLLTIGWLERLWARHRAPAPRRVRTKLKIIRGGKTDYDLADDDSTDSQRYLM